MGFRHIGITLTLRRENQMEKRMEHDMGTVCMCGFVRIRGFQTFGIAFLSCVPVCRKPTNLLGLKRVQFCSRHLLQGSICAVLWLQNGLP